MGNLKIRQILKLDIEIGQTFYDNNKNEVKVKKRKFDTLTCIVYEKQVMKKPKQYGEKEDTIIGTQISENSKKFDIEKIGILLFYAPEDCKKGRKLLEDPRYKWNYNNIYAYYTTQDDILRDSIIKDAPSLPVLTPRGRSKLIKSYSDAKLQEQEESEFAKKYGGKYFGRIDFDLEFYFKPRPDLYKQHFHEKMYYGKMNESIRDENGKEIIYSWRADVIRQFDGDNKRRFLEDEKEKYMYNYELLLKRRYYDDGSNKTLFIANNDELYKDGDVDPFLLEILADTRRRKNDRAVDIIRTIQSEQNEIICEDKYRNFYVQGCAGSGKTMILLHRLSYLLYNNNLDTSKIKIITPNENIIGQIKDLSAELEIANIEQMTLEKFYMYLLSKYNEQLVEVLQKQNMVIKNESTLPKEFLDYIYTDECKQILDKTYNSFFEDLLELPYFNDLLGSFSLGTFNKEYNYKCLQEYAKNLYNKYLKIYSAQKQNSLKIFQKEEIEKQIEQLTNKRDGEYGLRKQFLTLKKKASQLKKAKNSLLNLEKGKQELNIELDKFYLSKQKLEMLHKKYSDAKKSELTLDLNLNSLDEIVELEQLYKFKEKEVIHNHPDNYKGLKEIKATLENIRYNAKIFIENKLNESKTQELTLLAKIRLNKKQTKQISKLLNVNFDTVDYKIQITEEKLLQTENCLQKRNDVLNKQIQECQLQLDEIKAEIYKNFPCTENEEKNIIEQCGKMFVKNEDGYFETKIKYSTYRFVNNILEPFYKQLYERFGIEKTNNMYKFNLYFMLYVVVKLDGEKEICKMLNIDEAQDISPNEFELIKKTNKSAVFNLYGDTNQLLFENRGVKDWNQLKMFDLKPYKLDVNYRNSAPITEYCNNAIEKLNTKTLGIEGESVVEIEINDIPNFISNNAYVIVKDKTILADMPIQDYIFIENKTDKISEEKINVLTVEMAKGMEFSKVLVVDKNMNSREKYVAYTRALNELIVAR